MEYFDEDEKFLILEANLALTTIANGLDCLKHSNIYKKGLFYQAFFSLSIGIERLLKLVIIDKYRIENQGRFPNNKVMKDYGHHLYKMVNNVNPQLLNDKIFDKVVKFFDDFAQKTRYYNLDTLTGKKSNELNPIQEWDIIEKNIIKEYNVKIQQIQNKDILTNFMNQYYDVMYLDDSLETISSGIGILEELEKRQTLQEYDTLVCYKIIQSLVNVLVLQERKYNLYPYLWEIFDFFCGNSTDYEIRKKDMWMDIIK